ncbi:MAG: 50S ribosomal protein L29 [Candidatus Omnitrophica bacterium]|nr:50S ribosomal protein L29 [Candidatus Omnitrophota bacterium]
MKVKDLREFTDDELANKEKQLKKDLFDLNGQRQLGRVEKPANFRHIKKDIARILTVLSQRKNNGQKN